VAPPVVMVLENTGEASDAQPAEIDDASKAEEEDVGSGPATIIAAKKGSRWADVERVFGPQETQNWEYYKLFVFMSSILRTERELRDAFWQKRPDCRPFPLTCT
jgi:hypothetical protein